MYSIFSLYSKCTLNSWDALLEPNLVHFKYISSTHIYELFLSVLEMYSISFEYLLSVLDMVMRSLRDRWICMNYTISLQSYTCVWTALIFITIKVCWKNKVLNNTALYRVVMTDLICRAANWWQTINVTNSGR